MADKKSALLLFLSKVITHSSRYHSTRLIANIAENNIYIFFSGVIYPVLLFYKLLLDRFDIVKESGAFGFQLKKKMESDPQKQRRYG